MLSSSSLESPTESKAEVLKASLDKFYSDSRNLRIFTNVLRNRTKISLRTLDWLCTNYAKARNTTYVWNGQPLNVYLDYKASLKAYQKKSFDPFQRRERLDVLDADGVPLTTTLAQLCFFRWAISKGVLDFALKNVATIEADMLAATRHRKGKDASQKRHELSRAAVKSATTRRVPVTVQFK